MNAICSKRNCHDISVYVHFIYRIFLDGRKSLPINHDPEILLEDTSHVCKEHMALDPKLCFATLALANSHAAAL